VRELARDEDWVGGKAAGDQLRDRFLPLLHLLRSTGKPVVAEIGGIATGAGLGIALACDIRVVSTNAAFVMSPIGIGLIPGAGLTAMVPAMAGVSRATEWFMLGRSLEAAQLLDLGLVHDIATPDRLEAISTRWCRDLSAQPTTAIALIKRALNRSIYAELDDQIRYEAFLQEIAADSEDHRERLRDLLDRKER
jgi:2-(1,2-epoxy-1,2-dihydrophenyl)acetyl-CoA isomerase